MGLDYLHGHLIDATHVLVSEVVQVSTYLHPPRIMSDVPLEETPFGPSACCNSAVGLSISASESPSSTTLSEARLFLIRSRISGGTYMPIVDLPDSCEMMPWFY